MRDQSTLETASDNYENKTLKRDAIRTDTEMITNLSSTVNVS